MSLITLTTDFGTKDHFVGAVKGAIYSELPDAKIVDITHHISPFNITETAYILKNSYKSFPDKSIHIVGVDSELSTENKHIVWCGNHILFSRWCEKNHVLHSCAGRTVSSRVVMPLVWKRVERRCSQKYELRI